MASRQRLRNSVLVVALFIFIVGVLLIGWVVYANNTRNIQVTVQADAVETVVDAEEIPLPNCGGTGELSQSLSSQTMVKRSVSVGTRATTSVGEEVEIPQVVKLQLKNEVESAYQEVYEAARSRLDTIVMRAEKHTSVIYTVEWEEQEYSSVVSYVVGGEVYTAPYTYTLCVPKIRDSREVGCPIVTASWVPETPTVPPMPTYTPTATQIPVSTLTPTHTSTPTYTPTVTSTPRPRATPTPAPPHCAPPRLVGIEAIACNVTFKWDWPGTLASDEWFAVRVGKLPDVPHSQYWGKERAYTYSMLTLGGASGDYNWEVAVCRGDPASAKCEQLAVSERDAFWFGGCPEPPSPPPF